MGAEALEKVSLYWLCHLPEAGALQIRRIGELAGSFREAYYIEGTQLWKKGIFKKEENAYRFDNWKKEFSRLEEDTFRDIPPERVQEFMELFRELYLRMQRNFDTGEPAK